MSAPGEALSALRLRERMTQTQTPEAACPGLLPKTDYTQEVRFAVVMYGGSSLAIYMNGVAQELLRLVRATAPADAEMNCAHLLDDPPQGSDEGGEYVKGSERVYRKLGRLLKRGDGEDLEARLRYVEGRGPLRTRFVVDVLTGTSAGGINAVYLAKALANDQQLDKLMELWVEKGDIGVLLNVPPSAEIEVDDEPRALDFTGQPASPLNSSRMYWELLDAVRGMDGQSSGKQPLYAEELDLYVTATDTRGRILNMRLADKVAQEFRHRNAFHFRYRREGDDVVDNDFTQEYNPFLAFAARCTSAHQAAFEVMNMEAAGDIIGGTQSARQGEFLFKDAGLQKFYEEYLAQAGGIRLWKRENGKPVLENGKPVPLTDEEVEELRRQGKLREKLAEDFYDRFFNDGGTLDNSPFSFVSDILPFRQTVHPVDRKLLYVEPAPEHPEQEDAGNVRWNFVKNAVEGLATLPSYQTIVEDLTRIQERNRLIERVNHILKDLRDDIRARNRSPHGGGWPGKRGLEELRRMKLSDLIKENGVSWGGYQRLRIAQVTNDLTLLISRAAGLDEASAEFQAVRYLVRYWRLTRYEDHVEEDDKGDAPAEAAAQPAKVPEINFLIDFDLSWTIRRVQFLLRTIDELDCLDSAAHHIAEVAEQEGVKVSWPDATEEKAFREELRGVRREVNRVYARLVAARRSFWARRDDAAHPNPFRALVDDLEVSKEMMIGLLKLTSEQARQEMIEEYLKVGNHAAAFGALSDKVQKDFRQEILASSGECERLLDFRDASGQPKTDASGQLDLKASVRYVLFFYYKFFEDFDQVTFPIFYSTDVGEETDPIEVFRVSPEDACLLVNEQEENEERAKKKLQPVNKLAGTTLGHFGAFFDKRYRVNDILWGRLDGAERIISALLPGGPDLCDRRRDKTRPTPDEPVGDAGKIAAMREMFVREAHEAIILETWAKVRADFGEEDAALALAVEKALTRTPDPAARRELESGLKELDFPALWRHFLFLNAGKNGRDAVRDFKQAFIDSYEEERQFPPKRKKELIWKGAGVLKRIFLANLKEAERGKSPGWHVVVGLALAVVGLLALPVGVFKLADGSLRWAIEKVNSRVRS
jgi:patatin-related protein